MNLGFVLRVSLLRAEEGYIGVRPDWEAWIILSNGSDSRLHEFSGTQTIEMLSPPSQFMPYILSSEIPSSDSEFLLIKRRGTALTLKVLTQESGALGF